MRRFIFLSIIFFQWFSIHSVYWSVTVTTMAVFIFAIIGNIAVLASFATIHFSQFHRRRRRTSMLQHLILTTSEQMNFSRIKKIIMTDRACWINRLHRRDGLWCVCRGMAPWDDGNNKGRQFFIRWVRAGDAMDAATTTTRKTAKIECYCLMQHNSLQTRRDFSFCRSFPLTFTHWRLARSIHLAISLWQNDFRWSLHLATLTLSIALT